MKQILIKMLVNSGFITGISPLHINENGYPFLTLFGKNNTANNVYFGKESSKLIKAKHAKGADVLSELDGASIVLAMSGENRDQPRYKISLKGSSNYSGIAALSAMFGEVESDFDKGAFASEFTSLQDLTPPVEDDETDEELAEKLQSKASARKTAGAGK